MPGSRLRRHVSPEPGDAAGLTLLPGVALVHTARELRERPLTDGIQALCWPRMLRGDFEEILSHCHTEPGITTLEIDWLKSLELTPRGSLARRTILEDLEFLEAQGLEPVLDCVQPEVAAEGSTPVPIHVQSWHVDSANAPAETWLCTYAGESSQGLVNGDAVRRVEVPETRAALREEFGIGDDREFEEFLELAFYDLHYVPLPGARTWDFGRGNLWKISCRWQGCPVPPCVHRAPPNGPGTAPRLLLLS